MIRTYTCATCRELPVLPRELTRNQVGSRASLPLSPVPKLDSRCPPWDRKRGSFRRASGSRRGAGALGDIGGRHREWNTQARGATGRRVSVGDERREAVQVAPGVDGARATHALPVSARAHGWPPWSLPVAQPRWHGVVAGAPQTTRLCPFPLRSDPPSPVVVLRFVWTENTLNCKLTLNVMTYKRR